MSNDVVFDRDKGKLRVFVFFGMDSYMDNFYRFVLWN